MLSFNGFNLLGTHGPLFKQPPRMATQRTHFFGLHGESEIYGQAGGRHIEFEAWIHDDSFTSSAALVAYLEGIEGVIGSNGTLVRSGQVEETMGDCTFEGFMELPPGPLYDFAGTMSYNGNPAWFTRAVFRFYQLKIGAPAINQGFIV